VKNPGPKDTGIRYYRPKPYLLVTPGTEVAETADGKSKTTTVVDKVVSLTLQYMPDFSEEYSIHVRTGFGIANVAMKLDQGWNLTEINQQLDSQTDENVKAVAELTKSLGDVFRPAAGEVKGQEAGTEIRKWSIRATNVPLGYYEAVVGRDVRCQKRLFGWKYVGFMPYTSCPTDLVGQCAIDCNDPQAAVYGLVFEDGVMVFKQLAGIVPITEYVATPVSTTVSLGANTSTDLKTTLEKILHAMNDLKNASVDVKRFDETQELKSVTIKTGKVLNDTQLANAMAQIKSSTDIRTKVNNMAIYDKMINSIKNE